MLIGSFALFFQDGFSGLLTGVLFLACPALLLSFLLSHFLRSRLGKYAGMAQYLCFLVPSCVMVWYFVLLTMYRGCLKCVDVRWPGSHSPLELRVGHLLAWVVIATIFYLLVLFVIEQINKFLRMRAK